MPPLDRFANLRAVSTLVICLLCTVSAAAYQATASSKAVSSFEAHDSRALEVLRQLAEQEQVVIGVSGVLMGSDHKLISVSLSNTTIREVLNSISEKDSRYTWHDELDGTIEVTVGKTPLSLLGIIVHAWSVATPARYQLAEDISEISEVKKWLTEHSCELSELVIGDPHAQTLDINLGFSNETLRGVISQIARKTNTYFWSAIQYSQTPCAINLRP